MPTAGEITVEPNPAVEGQPVVITFPGPGPWFVRREGSSDGWTEVEVDAESNTARLNFPPSPAGGSFSVSDAGTPGTSTSVPVIAGE
jgi:hypothetical protein